MGLPYILEYMCKTVNDQLLGNWQIGHMYQDMDPHIYFLYMLCLLRSLNLLHIPACNLRKDCQYNLIDKHTILLRFFLCI